MAWLKMRYVETVKSKGRFYRYYRRDGRRLASLPGEFGSPEFAAAYDKAHAAYERKPNKLKVSATLPGSFKEMAQAYLESGAFKERKQGTREDYKDYIDVLIKFFGDDDRNSIRMSHVLAYRDTMLATPGKANAMIKCLRIVYGWGVTRDMVKHNPASFQGTPIRALKMGERQPWPEAAIERYIEEGETELAWVVQLGLYTGQRIGDVLKMGWGDISEGHLRVRQDKTGKELWIPLHKKLAGLLEAIPKRALRILTTAKGRVWTYNNFADQFMADRVNLGLTACVFHGLRKNAVNRLLEAGCTTQQVGSITGHSDEMVSYYAKGVDQKALAKAAVVKLDTKTK